jgi:hypothetical protein
MEKSGMDAVLEKLGKKLGRKPMLKRKGLSESSPMKESGMTVVIGMGKPSGASAKRDEKGYPTDEQDDTPVKETSPEGLSAKLDALMERVDALEAKLNGDDNADETDDESEMEEED